MFSIITCERRKGRLKFISAPRIWATFSPLQVPFVLFNVSQKSLQPALACKSVFPCSHHLRHTFEGRQQGSPAEPLSKPWWGYDHGGRGSPALGPEYKPLWPLLPTQENLREWWASMCLLAAARPRQVEDLTGEGQRTRHSPPAPSADSPHLEWVLHLRLRGPIAPEIPVGKTGVS